MVLKSARTRCSLSIETMMRVLGAGIGLVLCTKDLIKFLLHYFMPCLQVRAFK
ncbi:hypothetical protein Mapa_015532 [Marchantia paleacea]|nr:hypothetical protein Mapa_015532 [Marchantia paleacea]